MKRESTRARGNPYPGAQAVSRAVAILKAFSDWRPEWGATELGRELGLNKTTTFRLLAALEREGMVTRGAGEAAYRLGPDAIALGAQALRSNDLRSVARPELERLASEAGETTTLEILLDGEVLILDEVKSRFLLGTYSELGTRWPAHAASTGKVLLAEARFGRRDGTRPAPAPQARLAKLTPRTIASHAKLNAELAAVWHRGYAVAEDEIELGFIAVGAAVRNHEGRAVAALSVGGPSVRVTADRIPDFGRLARAAAERVSRRLGAAPSDPPTAVPVLPAARDEPKPAAARRERAAARERHGRR